MNKFSPYWLWALMAIPALPMVLGTFTSDDARIFHKLVHPSGEFAARFLIITLMITPLSMLFKGRAWTNWLRKNRRYFGVAAFFYALLHTVYYMIDKSGLDPILSDLPKTYIWTGWIAFAIFVPLALTSTDNAVRQMGTAWKALQRWTYVAAIFTLVHWAALHDWGGVAPAMVHFGPLIALSLYRLWWVYLRPRPMRA